MQTILKLVYPNLDVDGLVGPATRWAYQNAPAIVKDVIWAITGSDAVITSATSLSNDTVAEVEILPMAKQQGIISMLEAMMRAATKTGVPMNWLVAFARIESNFNPDARNGSHRGLFQFDVIAWNECRENEQSLIDYERGVWDVYQQSLAAATYMKINARRLAAYGINAIDNPEMLYLAHQQGAAGAAELWKADKGEHRGLYVTAEKMLRNPAPGSKPTIDQVAFFHSWKSYLEPMFS
jgi:hypothetical protein